MDHLILKEQNGIPYLQFPNLAGFEDIRHGIFTRQGGCSKAPYNGLNVGLGVGDSGAAVARNRSLIRQVMDSKELVFARQVHGTAAAVFSKSRWQRGAPVPEADALVTDITDKNLVIQTADCQAVLIYDPVKKVVGNVHSGWRGSVGNIIGQVVGVLEHRWGSDPGDLKAGIGPSLGPCCAEFVHYRKEIPERLWAYKDGRDCFDFWSMSFDQLCRAGVPADSICVSRMCTRCRTDFFFSYRSQKTTGRFAAVIGLR